MKKLFSKSKTKDYKRTVTAVFKFEDRDKKYLKGIKEDFILELKSNTRVSTVSRLKIKNETISTKLTVSNYPFSKPDIFDIRGWLISVCNKFECDITITDENNNSISYECAPKVFKVFYEFTEISERVAYIEAKTEEEAVEKFHDGDFDDSENWDYLDSYDGEVIDVQEDIISTPKKEWF